MGGWVGGWVAGDFENIATQLWLKLKLELSLATDNCYKSKGPRRQGAKTQQAPPLGFFTDMAFCIRFFHTPGLRGEGEVGWGLKMLS